MLGRDTSTSRIILVWISLCCQCKLSPFFKGYLAEYLNNSCTSAGLRGNIANNSKYANKKGYSLVNLIRDINGTKNFMILRSLAEAQKITFDFVLYFGESEFHLSHKLEWFHQVLVFFSSSLETLPKRLLRFITLWQQSAKTSWMMTQKRKQMNGIQTNYPRISSKFIPP